MNNEPEKEWEKNHQNPPALTKSPAQLILADIENKLTNFSQQERAWTSQIAKLKNQVVQLTIQVEKVNQEKLTYLTTLRNYWQRELNIYQLAQQITDTSLPNDRTEVITNLAHLNQQNANYQKKQTTSRPKSWVKKVFWWTLTLAIVIAIGGGVIFYYRKHFRSS